MPLVMEDGLPVLTAEGTYRKVFHDLGVDRKDQMAQEHWHRVVCYA